MPEHHRTSFRMLCREPVVSRSAARSLAALERAVGVELPGAIREWYSLDGTIDLLNLDGDLHFEPWTIQENAKRLKWAKTKGWSPWWIVGDYSSGVGFSAEFASGPDPVVRCVETDGSFVDHADEWTGRPFSAFVFACCWHKAREGAATAGGRHPAIGPDQLAALADLFEAGPAVRRGDYPPERPNPFTGERMRVTRFRYFFFGPDGRVYLGAREDPSVSATPAFWELIAADERRLRALSARLSATGLLRGLGPAEA